MRKCAVVAAVFTFSLSVAWGQQAEVKTGDCAKLASLSLPGTKVVSSELVPLARRGDPARQISEKTMSAYRIILFKLLCGNKIHAMSLTDCVVVKTPAYKDAFEEKKAPAQV